MSLHRPPLFTFIGVYTEDGMFAGNVLVPYIMQPGDTFIPSNMPAKTNYTVEAFNFRREMLAGTDHKP